MKAALFALAVSLALLLCAPVAQAVDTIFTLYAEGKYDAAMQDGAASGTASGLAIAARAALADAALRPEPCLDCLHRAEDYARRAIAADSRQADSHVWLAASLGLQGRIIGVLKARWRNMPDEAKGALDAALADDPHNPYALAALGGWNIEIVRAGGAYLARKVYGAGLEQGLALFDRAVKAAPGNVAVRYQIALSLSGFDPDGQRSRIESALEAAIHDVPETSYEKAMQGRAEILLALLKKNDRDGFDAKVHVFQGYPD